MKRIVAMTLVLCAFLGLSAQSACAETFYPTAIESTDFFDPTANDTFYDKTVTQTANRLITIYTQDINGNYVDPPVQMRLPIVTVTHKYFVQVGGDTDVIIGGYFNVLNHPKLGPAANAWPECEVKPEHTQNYSLHYVAATQGGQAYEAYCTGGYCTVTYNHILWFDYYGNLVDKEPTTVQLGYNCTATGTLAELLAENK